MGTFSYQNLAMSRAAGLAYRPARPMRLPFGAARLPGLALERRLTALPPCALALVGAIGLLLAGSIYPWVAAHQARAGRARIEGERRQLAAAVDDLARSSERLRESLDAQRDMLARQRWEPVSRADRNSFTALVTAYTSGPESTGKSPGHPEYGVTFSGTRAREWHTIAVDPNVIPLGSLVYIPYFADRPNKGVFVAEDTGSAVVGRHIDVYIPDPGVARGFKRELQVVVLRWGRGERGPHGQGGDG